MVFDGVQNYSQLLSKINDLYWNATGKHVITKEKLSLEGKFEIRNLFIIL
jgi:hypothetical protein